MHTLKLILNRILVFFLAGTIILSCDRNRHSRGYDYMPDMSYSQAYETYTENPNFVDSMTMRVPVHGTVPMNIIPFRYTLDSISRADAGAELVNPYPNTDTVIASGKELYTIYCLLCHGPQGNGDGHLFKSGLYPLQPRAISAEPTLRLRDGEIYHTITLGFASMGPYGPQILPDDRWKVVHYVRQLQLEVQKPAGP